MKTISKEFYSKIEREGGILDTKTYRYVISTDPLPADYDAKRIRIEYIGTTAALDKDNWEPLKVR